MKNEKIAALIDQEFIKRIIHPSLHAFDERLNEGLECEFPMEGEYGDEVHKEWTARMIAFKMICYDISMMIMKMSIDEKKHQTGITYSAELEDHPKDNVKH